MSENIQIKIGSDYFRRCAKNEYSQSMPLIWIREALQNSIDAGASRIDINLDYDYISVTDNGNGMDDKIISDKLLVLGGSFKNSSECTGGFGKAKEVLFFAWDFWEIKSSPTSYDSYYVSSDMINREPIKHITGKTNKGTCIKIKYDYDDYSKSSWEDFITNFVKTCTVKASIFLNGDKLETLPAKGKKLDYDNFVLRVNKSGTDDVIYIRINGITMFSRYVSAQIPATVTVDLKGCSVDMLSSSRESLKYSYQREIDKIVENILVNPRSVLEKNNKLYVDKYIKRGLEKLLVEIENTCDVLTGDLLKQSITSFIAGQKDAVNECIEDLKHINPELASKLELIINNEYPSELGYSYVVHRHNNKVPSIDPNSKKAKRIIHMWKTILDELTVLKYPGYEFIVGLDFNPSCNASYTKGCDLGNLGTKDHICINPTRVKSLKTAEMGTYLFFKACHELTHINRDYHNEYFLIDFETLLNELSNDPKKWFTLFQKAANESKDALKTGGV
jgi:hypothetical protein